MKNKTTLENAPDLTQRPPRSVRCRLGGYVILPRVLDKCRATLAGTSGDYNYNCPLDQQFFDFTGITPDALKEQVASGIGDGALLTWIQESASHRRTAWEIEQWSAYQEQRGPEFNTEGFLIFQKTAQALSPKRSDIRSWADLLDLDDHCSFGGVA